MQSFVQFQNLDPEIQMKDDGLQHISIYAIFFYLRGECHVNVK